AGNGAVLNNAADGVFSIRSNQSFLSRFGQRATFNNAGKLDKTGIGSGADVSTFETSFHNTGTVALQAGGLTFTAAWTQSAGSTTLSKATLTADEFSLDGGKFGGTGTVDGDTYNQSAIVSAGLSHAVLS